MIDDLEAAQAPGHVTLNGAQFAAVLKEALQVTVMGLMQRHNLVPAQMMIPALAAAMGMVMSEASLTPTLSVTLGIRKQIETVFADCLKKHVSALQAAPANMVKANGAQH